LARFVPIRLMVCSVVLPSAFNCISVLAIFASISVGIGLKISWGVDVLSARSLVWSRTSACHADDPGSNLGARTILSCSASLI
jgi:hypothetical protein